MDRHNTEIKDKKIQIKKDFKNYVHNAIPKRYMRHAGIGPYFTPLFGRIYWKRLEVALRLAKKYAPQEKPKIGDLGCGFDVLIALLSIRYDSQIIGIDTYPAEILKIAENISNRVSEKQNHFFIRDSIEDLSFKSSMKNFSRLGGGAHLGLLAGAISGESPLPISRMSLQLGFCVSVF